MSTLPSQPAEALTCEALSESDLQQVSGGVALVTGRLTQGIQLTTGRLVGGTTLGGIRPFNCIACVQGIPANLVNNPAVNPVLSSPLARF